MTMRWFVELQQTVTRYVVVEAEDENHARALAELEQGLIEIEEVGAWRAVHSEPIEGEQSYPPDTEE